MQHRVLKKFLEDEIVVGDCVAQINSQLIPTEDLRYNAPINPPPTASHTQLVVPVRSVSNGISRLLLLLTNLFNWDHI